MKSLLFSSEISIGFHRLVDDISFMYTVSLIYVCNIVHCVSQYNSFSWNLRFVLVFLSLTLLVSNLKLLRTTPTIYWFSSEYLSSLAIGKLKLFPPQIVFFFVFQMNLVISSFPTSAQKKKMETKLNFMYRNVHMPFH